MAVVFVLSFSYIRVYFNQFIQWERQFYHRLESQREQGKFIIVPGAAVFPEQSAIAAAVDNRPFAARPDRYRYRVHNAAADRAAVTRPDIDVEAAQAPWAMVAVAGAAGVGRYRPPAVAADEAHLGGRYSDCFASHEFLTSIRFFGKWNNRGATATRMQGNGGRFEVPQNKRSRSRRNGPTVNSIPEFTPEDGRA